MTFLSFAGLRTVVAKVALLDTSKGCCYEDKAYPAASMRIRRTWLRMKADRGVEAEMNKKERPAEFQERTSPWQGNPYKVVCSKKRGFRESGLPTGETLHIWALCAARGLAGSEQEALTGAIHLRKRGIKSMATRSTPTAAASTPNYTGPF